MSLQDRADKLVADFSKHKTWEDKYKEIISLGKSLPGLPEELKTEDALVRGCQSKVWLHVSFDDLGRMQLRGDSDALLVKGLVAVVLSVYNGAEVKEVVGFQPRFLEQMGFRENLSPSRANGLVAMIRQIHLFALVRLSV